MRTSEATRPATPRALIVSSYPPQQCGIASFSEDLTTAIAARYGSSAVAVAAVSDAHNGVPEPRAVHFRIDKHDLASYRACADMINDSSLDVICLQHEFGLFGGKEGAFVLELMRRARKPIVTTLHTVMSAPPLNYRQRMLEIIRASDHLVVLTQHATSILRDVYGVSRDDVSVIAHGIPDLPFESTVPFKRRFDAEGRDVLLTFGLIGPGKGIEHMLEALPSIVARHPRVLYMIVGATHPGVLATHGDGYRERLQQMVRDNGLEQHVVFHNRYVDDDELHDFLRACDIYVTPYQNRDQISSGTLSYAVGAGCAVVSTDFWYARDLLAEGRGRLVPPGNWRELARAITSLLEDPREREAIRRRAYMWSRRMTWENVGSSYVELFERLRLRAAVTGDPFDIPMPALLESGRMISPARMIDARSTVDKPPIR